MIDLIKLHLRAGDGGDGRVNFRREKYVPKGGPDGGDGGDGGDVIVRGVGNKSSLQHLAGVKSITAKSGQRGGPKKMKGSRGENVVIEVPVGTRVWLLSENELSQLRRERYSLRNVLTRDEVERQKFYLEKEGQSAPKLLEDEMTPVLTEDQTEDNAEMKKKARQLKQVLAESSDTLKGVDFKNLPKQRLIEIEQEGEEVVLCQGGFGGRGNNSFKSSFNTTPLEAEYGSGGEEKVVVFEQLLLADIGLVGFPNAGKSTLVSVLTSARPKVGNYPFTTLEPSLGIMQFKDQELTIADIPGLIEGASEGKGLGHAFLRHVEHTRKLVFVLFLEEEIIFDESLSDEEKAKKLWEQLEKLEQELQKYDELVGQKPKLLVVNKIDLYSSELRKEIEKLFKKKKREALLISGATGDGLEELKQALI